VSRRSLSPFSLTDYVKRTRKKDNSFYRFCNVIDNKRRTRPACIYGMLLLLLFIALIGLVLFFTHQRLIHIKMYEFSSTLVRVCNDTEGVSVTFEVLKTIFSVENPNYFPLTLSWAKLKIGFQSWNRTCNESLHEYKFEITQTIQKSCKQKSFCTGLESFVNTRKFVINGMNHFESDLFLNSCHSNSIVIEVVVETIYYMFLGREQRKSSTAPPKLFSTPCSSCANIK